MAEFSYIGQELDIFAHAQEWKAYWASKLRPYVRGDVLEAGAGIGTNTLLLAPAKQGRWVCLEPDPQLLTILLKALGEELGRQHYEAIAGTTQDVQEQRFDTILYIDVLEHIEADAEELRRATNLLRPGGRIVVLSPAHQWLFSPFDAAIGHYRRYNRSMLQAISPPGMITERIFYMDSVGLLASSANKLLLKQSTPALGQIQFWDRFMVPISRRILDPIVGFGLGKTIVAIWQKPPQP